MWTIVRTSLWGLKLQDTVAVLAILLVASVLGYGLIKHERLKAELASTTSALAAEKAKLTTCNGVIQSYQDATAKLQAEHQKALEKATQVSTRTRQLVSTSRSQPVDNNLDSIRKQGLSTAPAAVDLWTR